MLYRLLIRLHLSAKILKMTMTQCLEPLILQTWILHMVGTIMSCGRSLKTEVSTPFHVQNGYFLIHLLDNWGFLINGLYAITQQMIAIDNLGMFKKIST